MLNQLYHQDCVIGKLVTPQVSTNLLSMNGQKMEHGVVYVITIYNINWFQSNCWAFLLVQ